jgi:hypothetical protein
VEHIAANCCGVAAIAEKGRGIPVLASASDSAANPEKHSGFVCEKRLWVVAVEQLPWKALFCVHVRSSVLCTWRSTASMVNDADGVIYVKLTVKIVNYAVNRHSLVTVTPFLRSLFTVPFLNDAVCAQHCRSYERHVLKSARWLGFKLQDSNNQPFLTEHSSSESTAREQVVQVVRVVQALPVVLESASCASSASYSVVPAVHESARNARNASSASYSVVPAVHESARNASSASYSVVPAVHESARNASSASYSVVQAVHESARNASGASGAVQVEQVVQDMQLVQVVLWAREAPHLKFQSISVYTKCKDCINIDQMCTGGCCTSTT